VVDGLEVAAIMGHQAKAKSGQEANVAHVSSTILESMFKALSSEPRSSRSSAVGRKRSIDMQR